MLLTKTLTLPVSPVKQPVTFVTSERPFIPLSQPAIGQSLLDRTPKSLQIRPVSPFCSLLNWSVRSMTSNCHYNPIPLKSSALTWPAQFVIRDTSRINFKINL